MNKVLIFINSKCYLEFHENADGDYDYTLYGFDLNEIDGGVIAGFLTEKEVLTMVSVLHDLTLSDFMPELDYDTFSVLVDNRLYEKFKRLEVR